MLGLLSEPVCAGCEETTDQRWCSACDWELARPLRALDHRGTLFSGAWALGDYAGPVGTFVRRAKFGDNDEVAERLIASFVASADAVVPAVGCIVSVGTTPWRRLIRGLHLPDLAAHALSRRRGVPVVPALHRRWSGAQSRLSRGERRARGGSAFRAVSAVSGRVLLIDDVLTTGATAHACAAELLSSGAAQVFLAVIASSGRPPVASVGIS